MKKLLLLSFLFFSLSIQAQDTIGMHSAQITDTVLYASTDSTFYATVINTGDSAYTGNISVFLGIEKNNVITVEDTIVLSANSLLPNDTIGGQFLPQIFDSTTTEYRVGGNIVVIWPAANDFITGDSIKTNLYVKEITTGVLPNSALNKPTVYPNPTNDFLYFSKAGLVTFYSASGALIKQSSTTRPNAPVDVSVLPSGIYFVELKESSKEKASRFKFIRQ